MQKSMKVHKNDLLSLWSKTLSYVNLCINETTAILVSELEAFAAGAVKKSVEGVASHASIDKKIYRYYRRLIAYYEKTITLYQQNQLHIDNEKVTVILSGISQVLSLSVKQFKENIDKYKPYSANLYDEALSSYRKSLEDMMIDIQNDNVLKCALLQDHIDETLFFSITVDALLKTKQDELNEELEKIMIDMGHTAITAQSKEAFSFFFDSIIEENANLASIIKIQAMALENEMTDKVNKNQEKYTQEILTTLREAYQYLGKEIDELSCYLKQPEDALLEERLQPVRIPVLSDIKPRPVPYYKKYKANFDRVKEEFSDEVKKYFYTTVKSDSYFLSKEVSEISMMTDEIIQHFNAITHFFQNNPCPSGHAILNGVKETIEIKVESLLENKESFMQSIRKRILDFSQKQADLSKDDIDSLLSLWIKNRIESPDETKRIQQFIEARESAPYFKDKIFKSIQKEKDSVTRKLVAYLREQLFFELSTFEEINYYSVIRLRAETDEIIQKFVAEFDSCVESIEQSLKKYNVSIIKPKPLDVFDGKEHEVLMAEKHENLSKGQIVKLLNSGYRYNNTVVLRANVIAAK